jgi:hypothetical protein
MATDARSLLEIAQSYSAPGLAVRARFEGALPGMLMHSAASMELSIAAAEKHRAAGKRTKYIPPAPEEAEWGLYRLDDGVLYLPAQNILRCLVEAAKAFKMPKSRSSMKNAVAAGVTVPFEVGFGFPLLAPDTFKPISEWKIDTRRVVIQRAAIMRSRPLIEHWSVEASFLLDVDAVPPHIFAEIVGYSGARVGVCDFRPEKGGQFGRFTVTELDVVE